MDTDPFTQSARSPQSPAPSSLEPNTAPEASHHAATAKGAAVSIGGVTDAGDGAGAGNDVEHALPAQRIVSLVRGAYAAAEATELARAREQAALLAAVAAHAAEGSAMAAKLEAHGSTTSTPDATAIAAAQASASAAAAAEVAASERANAAEADRDAYAARSAALEAEKAAAEDAVARAADAAAKDAAALSAAETRILDLTAFLAGAEARLQSSAGENAALLREGRDSQVEALATEKRLSFVEADRVRMAGELAEIRAQRDMDAAAHEKQGGLARAHVADLEASLELTGQRAAVAEERVSALDRQIADLQADRERARADAQREIDNLNNQLEIHRENSSDTQARMRELKEVIAGMSATMRATEARAVASGTLGTHADGILRHVQAELDNRLDELEAERKAFELARSNERKMAIAMEALIREKDTAIALAQDAENRARSLETEVEELHRRNDRLERRLMLAGDLATAQQGIVTSPGMFDNGMQIAPFERPQLQLTPSKQALNGILNELGGIKRRHDELMTTLAVQRDMYREFS
jgi:hypothetical protein